MRRLLAPLVLLLCAASPAFGQGSYQLFEAGQVRPLALSPDGNQLFAVNTPDDHLEIFDVDGNGDPTHVGAVQVGMRPVAVAARTNDEVWVVNHLSDSISIVKLTPQPHVARTLLLGDEPRDLVFAGPSDRWAFVTTAHRGQHSPNGGRINRTTANADDQSQFDDEGVGRADVWVFDTTDLGSELGGTPELVISLFGDKPRALAVSPDGNTVYAAIFRSGNRTTVVNEGLVCETSNGNMNSNTVQGGCTSDASQSLPGGYPTPHKNSASANRPETGLILKFDRPGETPGRWTDELDRDWDSVVKFDLPDLDVFAIDASVDPPAPVNANANDPDDPCLGGTGCWANVGTTLFNMIVNPVNQKVYVSNTEAQNHVRFEGPGTHASGMDGKTAAGEPSTVQGNLAQSRITVLDGSNVLPRHLNNHLDYSALPAPTSDRDKSLATPLGMAVSTDGSTLYVTGFGSAKVHVYDTTELENDTFDADNPDQIALGGGGPTGLVLNGNRLYVLTRFDNSVRSVNLGNQNEASFPLHNPEPLEVLEGRPFLYDAVLTSSNGEASCSSCHIFADMDDLAWDLGNPDDPVLANLNPFNPIVPINPLPLSFHPMKGPMTTQSLRGLENMGPQHWRGDRQGNEVAAFEAFNVAFPGLVGRASEFSSTDMEKFRKFALLLRYPPNPIRKIDNSMRPDESAGFALYNSVVTDIVATCNQCHVLNAANGHFGGDGQSVFDGEPQHLKIPHLRNAYQKVGMFGMSEPDEAAILMGAGLQFTGDFTHQGPQVRGFGFLHDGSVDSMARFLGLDGFSLDTGEEVEMEAFMMAFPAEIAPAVGQQATLTQANFSNTDIDDQIDDLVGAAETAFTSEVLGSGVNECDLVAKLLEGGAESGYLYVPEPGSGTNGTFLPDDGGAAISRTDMRNKAQIIGQEVTYTCQTPGAGNRTALDRDQDSLTNGVETDTGVFVSASDTGTSPAAADTDGDGFDDGVEVSAGTNPNNPNSYPGSEPLPPVEYVPSLAPAGLSLLGVVLGAVGAATLRRRRR